MKLSHVFTVLVSVVFMSACKKDLTGSGNIITETRTPGSFNAIKSEGDFRVFLIKDDISTVDLIGDDNVLNKIETEVKNGRLTIQYAPGINSHSHRQVDIYVRTSSIDWV